MLRPALLAASIALATGCSLVVDPSGLAPETPARPTGLTATAGDGKVLLAWDPHAGDVSGFDVYSGSSADTLAKVTTASGSATTSVVSGLANGTTYWFALAAVDSGRNVSSLSAVASATAGGLIGLAPSVASSDPGPGAAGVPTTAPIEITFSEPMDTASVEAAFSSSPTIACSWAWSAGNTVATCSHAAALAPSTFTSVSLSMTAADTTGSTLASAWSMSFTTAAAPANHGSVTLYVTSALDGTVWSSPLVVTNAASLYAGDNDLKQNGRAFLSFDLGQLPGNVTAISSATLGVYQENGAQLGAPYADLGALWAERVEFGAALDAADLDLSALDGANYVLSSDATAGWKTVEVGPSVAAAWSSRATLGNRAQFRLRFATNTDNDAAGDTARFSSGEGSNPPYLVIQYDYP